LAVSALLCNIVAVTPLEHAPPNASRLEALQRMSRHAEHQTRLLMWRVRALIASVIKRFVSRSSDQFLARPLRFVGCETTSNRVLLNSLSKPEQNVAVVAFVADFVFPALDRNVSLERGIDASNNHGRRSISSSSQSKTTFNRYQAERNPADDSLAAAMRNRTVTIKTFSVMARE